MNVVIIDDEAPSIEEIKYYLKEYEVNVVATYTNPIMALENIGQNNPDIVFVDIDMPCMNGIELAESIQSKLHDIIIVFITAYSQYALEAFRVHPIDYVLKPIHLGAFRNTMQHVMKQYHLILDHLSKDEESKQPDKIKINCFGKFEIIKNDNEVMKFTTKKSKELFAYLLCNVDKAVYRDDVIHCLFGNGDVTKTLNNFYVTLHRLRSTLEKFGLEKSKCLIKENSSIYIEDGICNYVDFCRFIKNNYSLTEHSMKKCEILVQQYHGDLFSDIDEIWADEARVWMDIQMESLIIKMTSYYLTNSEYEKAEQVLNHLIEVNPMSTTGFEMLMDIYIKTDNRTAYRLIYKKYTKLMQDEMELEIGRKYSNYYLK